MNIKKVLYPIFILIFIFQLFSCSNIRLVVVNKKKSKPGRAFFGTTYYSKYKKLYNHPKYERTYYLHQGDTVYKIDNAVFEPAFKGDPKRKHQAIDWYDSRHEDIHVTGILNPVEPESYNFYLNTASIDRKKHDKKDFKHCYQTHFFADTSLYSMGDNISLKEQDVTNVSISMSNKRKSPLFFILVPSAALVGLVIAFFSTLKLSS